ncbi:MAG: hypothetical protein ACR2NI_06810 [Pirellulales bacterium]
MKTLTVVGQVVLMILVPVFFHIILRASLALIDMAVCHLLVLVKLV